MAKTYNSNMSKAHGFTLVEALIALLLLSFALISLAKFQSSVIQSNTAAKQRTEATVYAQNLIENIRSQISPSNPPSNIQNGRDEIQSENTLFSRVWTVNDIITPNALSTNGLELKISVSWPDRHKINPSGIAVASDSTTVYLSTIFSHQPFSDSGLHLKYNRTSTVKIIDD